MLPAIVRNTVVASLAGTPDVLERLLAGMTAGDPALDAHPDPDRFSVREVLAHLADWNPIFLGRIVQTREQEQPRIADIDEAHLAAEREYMHAEPRECLLRFRQGREALVQYLAALPDDAWDRVAHRHFGPITIEGQAVLINAHDGYHLREVALWLASRKG